MKKNLYIIGMPASGKTTIGKWLAEKMGVGFLDIDEAIVEKTGLSIYQYFKEFGEESFRNLETQILRESDQIEKRIISCGGGTVAHSDNMKWVLNHGLTLFLNTDQEIILQRIQNSFALRPMFESLSVEEIRKKLQEIHENRVNFFSQSKIIWNKSTPSNMLYVAVNQLIKD